MQTKFHGTIALDRALSSEMSNYLRQFSKTRHCRRHVYPVCGVEGEFYLDTDSFDSCGIKTNVIDYHQSPETQPGLWCHWVPTENNQELYWNSDSQDLNHTEWLQYVIDKLLFPSGYYATGYVVWDQGRYRQGFVGIYSGLVIETIVDTKP